MAMKSSLKNMVLVLGAITLVAAAAVGGIYRLTKKAIDRVQNDNVNTAIAAVVPPFDNIPVNDAVMREVDGETMNVYPARDKDGKTLGYAVETFSKTGFGGRIDLMVGFLSDGSIKDIAVVGHNETPGLGDKIEKGKSNFSVQFEGKNPERFNLAVRQDGGDVDAITASTITSRAYSDAVRRAYTIFKTLEKQDEL